MLYQETASGCKSKQNNSNSDGNVDGEEDSLEITTREQLKLALKLSEEQQREEEQRRRKEEETFRAVLELSLTEK